MQNSATNTETRRERARQRAEMILKVRGGQLSAAEAARALSISRKTYYKWEKRGLAALLEGLCERNSGRPASPSDGEPEDLKRNRETLERELQRQAQRQAIRTQLRAEGEKRG